MSTILELFEGLKSPDNNHAYKCLQELENISGESDAVYQFFDVFHNMLDDVNSYIRTRGLILIVANAKWDFNNKIDEIIVILLKSINDEKPITARKCITLLPDLVKYKPELKNIILTAINRANPSKYKETMRPLIIADIQKSLKEISKL